MIDGRLFGNDDVGRAIEFPGRLVRVGLRWFEWNFATFFFLLVDASECGGELIVFGLGDGVILVIMAAAAVGCQTEESLPQCSHQIFHVIPASGCSHHRRAFVVSHLIPGAADVIAGCHEGVEIIRL